MTLPFLISGLSMENEENNWLLLVPERNLAWEINAETNLVELKKPKLKNKWLKKYLLPYMKNPEYRVKLDNIGTFVWNNIDGKQSCLEISEKMKREFGSSVDPVEERLGKFFQSLIRYDFILFPQQEQQ